MAEKLEQAQQGVLAKLNFVIEDEAKSHEIDARELRQALIERLFEATPRQLREMLHVEGDRRAVGT